jgi:hypothetical protein
MGEITLSIDAIIGLLIGIVIPTILFFWRMHYISKKVHDMHVSPDDHGFGTQRTNALLIQHMDDEAEMHRESIHVTKRLDYTIKELSHYIQWGYKQVHGREAPPYVRGHEDDG